MGMQLGSGASCDTYLRMLGQGDDGNSSHITQSGIVQAATLLRSDRTPVADVCALLGALREFLGRDPSNLPVLGSDAGVMSALLDFIASARTKTDDSSALAAAADAVGTLNTVMSSVDPLPDATRALVPRIVAEFVAVVANNAADDSNLVTYAAWGLQWVSQHHDDGRQLLESKNALAVITDRVLRRSAEVPEQLLVRAVCILSDFTTKSDADLELLVRSGVPFVDALLPPLLDHPCEAVRRDLVFMYGNLVHGANDDPDTQRRVCESAVMPKLIELARTDPGHVVRRYCLTAFFNVVASSAAGGLVPRMLDQGLLAALVPACASDNYDVRSIELALQTVDFLLAPPTPEELGHKNSSKSDDGNSSASPPFVQLKALRDAGIEDVLQRSVYIFSVDMHRYSRAIAAKLALASDDAATAAAASPARRERPPSPTCAADPTTAADDSAAVAAEASRAELALSECRARLGSSADHPELAAALMDVAAAMAKAGRSDVELDMAQQALAMRRRLHPSEDQADVAQSLSRVGIALSRHQGRLDEGLAMEQSALEMRRRLFAGADHEDLARSLDNVGVSLEDAGRATEGAALLLEALEMRRRLFRGADHADLAASLDSVGVSLDAQGWRDEGLALKSEALEMRRRLFRGADHADLAGSLGNVGASLEAVGRAQEGLDLHRQCLAMHRRLYRGGDHTKVAMSLSNVAAALGRLDLPAEAAPLTMEALAMNRRLCADADNAHVAASLANAGLALVQMGDADKGVPLQHEALAMYRRLFKGADHNTVALAVYNVGLSLMRAGDVAGAGPLVREALAMQLRLMPGVDHPVLVHMMHNQASLLQAEGRADEAADIARQADEMQQRL